MGDIGSGYKYGRSPLDGRSVSSWWSIGLFSFREKSIFQRRKKEVVYSARDRYGEYALVSVWLRICTVCAVVSYTCRPRSKDSAFSLCGFRLGEEILMRLSFFVACHSKICSFYNSVIDWTDLSVGALVEALNWIVRDSVGACSSYSTALRSGLEPHETTATSEGKLGKVNNADEKTLIRMCNDHGRRDCLRASIAYLASVF